MACGTAPMMRYPGQFASQLELRHTLRGSLVWEVGGREMGIEGLVRRAPIGAKSNRKLHCLGTNRIGRLLLVFDLAGYLWLLLGSITIFTTRKIATIHTTTSINTRNSDY